MPTAWDKRAKQTANDTRSTPIRLVGRKDPVLHRPAALIAEFNEDLLELAKRMRRTMYDKGGVAIAAPQVGHGIQLVVVKDAVDDNECIAVCNPVLESGGPLVTGEESCLSIPGRKFEVPRHKHAVMVGRNLDGEEVGVSVSDFHARMWQHELDHLAGLLLIGRFPEVRRSA